MPPEISTSREPRQARNSQLQSGLVFGFWVTGARQKEHTKEEHRIDSQEINLEFTWIGLHAQWGNFDYSRRFLTVFPFCISSVNSGAMSQEARVYLRETRAFLTHALSVHGALANQSIEIHQKLQEFKRARRPKASRTVSIMCVEIRAECAPRGETDLFNSVQNWARTGSASYDIARTAACRDSCLLEIH